MTDSEEMKNEEKNLLSRLYRFDCPDPSMLGDFHFGFLPEKEMKEIEDHVKLCPLCRQELADLREFLDSDPVPVKAKLETLNDEKKIIPFPRNEVQYLTPEIKTAVRGGGVKEYKKIRIFCKSYKDKDYVDLFYSILKDDMFYIFKGQFVMNESLENQVIDSMIEIWQNNKIKTVAKIDDLCSFRCVISELKPLVIRISNRAGTILSFQLDVQK